MMKNN